MELYPVLHGSLDGSGVWGRIDSCIHMAESLCCLPGIITTLLIGYTPIQNKKFKIKKKMVGVSHIVQSVHSHREKWLRSIGKLKDCNRTRTGNLRGWQRAFLRALVWVSKLLIQGYRKPEGPGELRRRNSDQEKPKSWSQRSSIYQAWRPDEVKLEIN